jgi:solute carrier family 25 carnitine/acylcarnitine transporter 20/29
MTTKETYAMPNDEQYEMPIEQAVAKKPDSALKSFLSGGVGGICVVLVGHPLDLIKVRMQTGGIAGASGSVLGIFANTFRTEGMRGLYRGVSAPLLAVSPIFAISFWGYDIGQRLVQYVQPSPGDLSLTQKCVAGGLSAIPTTAIMAPSERIKCLLQTNGDKYKGMKDCATAIYREGGFASLFRGTGATLLRDVPGSMAWFGTYEAVKMGMMKAQGIEDTSQLSPSAVLTAGGLAGMACWVISIPADVLKSRYQTAPEGMYRGLGDVYKKLMAEEGAGALFTGIRPALIRAFPANAACFFGMEVARKVFSFMD